MGKPFMATLNVVASSIHLNVKCNNMHDESVTIFSKLVETWWIHKALQCDQSDKEKEKAMEINVTSLIEKLREMDIKPPRKGIVDTSTYDDNNPHLTYVGYHSE